MKQSNDSSFVLDEDIFDFLGDYSNHKVYEFVMAINNVLDSHRQTLNIDCIQNDEDLAALQRDQLIKIYNIVAPDSVVNFESVASYKILALILAALRLIEYKLPAVGSPIVAVRTFPKRIDLKPSHDRAYLENAIRQWMAGQSDIDITQIGEVTCPFVEGVYLVLDEHSQVRYGTLFKNSNNGWTFSESYDGGGAAHWYSGPDNDCDDVSISLLTNWVWLINRTSPNRRSTQPAPEDTDEIRIFRFLTALSPHVKAELVVHFDGVIDKPNLSSVEKIGHLTKRDWQIAAKAVADDVNLTDHKSWYGVDAWKCFHCVLESLGFNFKTHEFDPSFKYSTHDDE